MGAGKLRCRLCKSEHSPSAKNFPLKFYGRVAVYEGKGKNRKIIGYIESVIGYGCRKCYRKGRREQFIREHKIKPGVGQRISDAIKQKLDSLKGLPKNKRGR